MQILEDYTIFKKTEFLCFIFFNFTFSFFMSLFKTNWANQLIFLIFYYGIIIYFNTPYWFEYFGHSPDLVLTTPEIIILIQSSLFGTIVGDKIFSKYH